MNERAAIRELRRAGLRATAQRGAVLEWLDDNPHATADHVLQGVRGRLGAVSVQAIYDVLGACVKAGLIRRIALAGRPARFERRTGDNHHHVTCRCCGRTEDVDCAVDARPCLTPSQCHGFEVDEAEVVFWGICPDCRTAGVPARRDLEKHQHANGFQSGRRGSGSATAAPENHQGLTDHGDRRPVTGNRR